MFCFVFSILPKQKDRVAASGGPWVKISGEKKILKLAFGHWRLTRKWRTLDWVSMDRTWIDLGSRIRRSIWDEGHM